MLSLVMAPVLLLRGPLRLVRGGDPLAEKALDPVIFSGLQILGTNVNTLGAWPTRLSQVAARGYAASMPAVVIVG